MIGSSGISREEHFSAGVHATQGNGFHLGDDRGTDRTFRYAELGQDVSLAFAASSTVGSHGGEDEGLQLSGSKARHRCPYKGLQVVHAARPDTNRDALARPSLSGKIDLGERFADDRFDILENDGGESAFNSVELRHHVLAVD